MTDSYPRTPHPHLVLIHQEQGSETRAWRLILFAQPPRPSTLLLSLPAESHYLKWLMWERLMDKTDISVCAAEWKLEMVPQTFRVSEEKKKKKKKRVFFFLRKKKKNKYCKTKKGVEDINTHSQVLVGLKWLILSVTHTVTLIDQLQDIIYPAATFRISVFGLRWFKVRICL